MKNSWMIGDSKSQILNLPILPLELLTQYLVRSGHLIDESNSNSKFTIDSIKQSIEVIKT